MIVIENLIALRELALRQVAEHVDRSLESYMAAKEIDDNWAVRERLAVEQLQDEDERLAFFEDVEDLADVGMIHAGQGSRFPPKPGAGFFAFIYFEDGLYRNRPFEVLVPCLKHNPHCPLADLAPDPVVANGFQHAVIIVPPGGGSQRFPHGP